MKSFKLDSQIANFDYDGLFGKLIGPKSVAAWLRSLKDGEDAEIEINSPGGSVVAGLAIANGVKNSRAHIRAHIVGIAASMASVVACACEKVVMEEGSLVMIHDPWVGEMSGNAEELRKEADILDSMKQACMGFYRSKFARTEEEISAMMSEESWWNGREAAEKGFACEVVASDAKIAACACSFKNLPESAKAFVKDAIDAETMKKIEAEVEAAEKGRHGEAQQTEEDSEAVFTKRLAAAMKTRDEEINGLKAKLAEAEKKRDDLQLETAAHGAEIGKINAERDALAQEVRNLKDQLSAKEQELTKATASVTSLAERAEKAEQEFARTRDQLAELTKAHASLMGGVLTPRMETDEAQKERELKAAKSAEEREAVRRRYSAKARK